VAAADADLISEAVAENPKLKGRVLAQFNALCPSRTIFATNTSTLLPSQFAKAAGRPDRLIALHFRAPDAQRSTVVRTQPDGLKMSRCSAGIF
jgi:3-hydroxybutyryl-CoA dehydrogenase